MSRDHSSLYVRQLSILLLAGSIPLVLLLVIISQGMEQRVREEAYRTMKSITSMAKESLEDRFQQHVEKTQAVAAQVGILLDGEEELQKLSASVEAACLVFHQTNQAFAIHNREGIPLGSNRYSLGKAGGTRAFERARDGTPSLSEVHPFVHGSGKLVAAYYSPVEREDGWVPAVVRHRIPVHELIPTYNGKGRLLWVNEFQDVLLTNRFQSLADLYPGCDTTEREGTCTDAKGEVTYLYIATNINTFTSTGLQPPPLDEPADWSPPPETLIHLMPLSVSRASMEGFRMSMIYAGLLSFVLLALLSFYASDRMSRPLKAAAAATYQLAGGDLHARVPEKGPLEIQLLARALNTMTREVRVRREHLEEAVSDRTARLYEINAYTRAIMEGLDDALVVIDPGRDALRYINRAGVELFGFDQAIADLPVRLWKTRLDSWFPEESTWPVFWSEHQDIPETRRRRFSINHPTIQALDVTSAPVPGTPGHLWLFHDATEQVRTEAERRQSQKLEAVGRLAGGLAHDFNNILTAIQGGLELLQFDLNDGRSPDEALELSLAGCERASGIVSQLLSFSREHPLERTVLHLQDIIRDTVALARPSIDRLVRIHADLPDLPVPVEGNAIQLEQVLMNLLINASHAMPKGGDIHIRLCEKVLPASPDQGADAFALLTVSDSGHGIPSDVLENIFDPFFTTKAPGKGTGLGLATSRAIIQRHLGTIDCKSQPGKGTRFTIHLPLAQHVPAAPAAALKVAPPLEILQSARILLVDDEAAIRTFAKLILKREHHHVTEAADGLKAIHAIQSASIEFDLVILDLTMPNMSGAEAFQRIKALRSNLPVLICSGHSADAPALFESAELAPDGFLSKPFHAVDLLAAVRKILGDDDLLQLA